MKNLLFFLISIFIFNSNCTPANAQPSNNLKIILVRHGEKEVNGNNLNCQGFNRSIQLPKIIIGKFGIPAIVFAPSLGNKKSTAHSRMFQTATPLAIKYGVAINTKYQADDFTSLAQDLEASTGTILVVWEHNAMHDIIKALGIKAKGINWGDNDFDSIWIVTYKNGIATLSMDKEGIKPTNSCPF